MPKGLAVMHLVLLGPMGAGKTTDRAPPGKGARAPLLRLGRRDRAGDRAYFVRDCSNRWRGRAPRHRGGGAAGRPSQPRPVRCCCRSQRGRQRCVSCSVGRSDLRVVRIRPTLCWRTAPTTPVTAGRPAPRSGPRCCGVARMGRGIERGHRRYVAGESGQRGGRDPRRVGLELKRRALPHEGAGLR